MEARNAEGTSPRTRGKHQQQPTKHPKTRNIPAHAGKTSTSLTTARIVWEHPRARGENSIIHSANYTEVGTSPRTRGKLVVLSCLIHPWGNIPAHAGKTTCRAFEGEQVGEHPRARGENTPGYPSGYNHGGTSPRTRGKLKPAWDALGAGRNIPAHAGKTSNRRQPTFATPEHPRARGENFPF